MQTLRQLTWITFKLYIREPIAAFFTLAFPTMLVLLFGAIWGNDPSPLFGGRGSMDVSLPAYSGLIVGTIGLMQVPITTAGYREQGILRRFRVTPLRPWVYIVADQCTNLVMTMLGMILVSTVAGVIFRVQFDGEIWAIVIALTLGTLAMSAFGYLIASLASTARIAQVIGMVIFYPMMFLSGAGMPSELLPDTLQRLADYLPLTYVVRLLRGLWFGETLGAHWVEVAVLSGIILVGGVLAARFFRWE
ncbi:MAG: ABC transporter permease [Anaerolineales bacterium]|nr:MAG: ABC transporter permease [Anaerolineales bacterium]